MIPSPTTRTAVMKVSAPLAWAALLGFTSLLATTPAEAETRGYVVSSFMTANNSADFKEQCPEDRNKAQTEWLIRDLIATGFTKEESIKIIESANDTIQLGPEMMRKLESRAIVNGKHVNIYNFPDAVPDPNVETVTGKYAYGFDLGQPNKANKFIDPETHQQVDNQLWRAVGCMDSWRAHPPLPAYIEGESSQDWALQISGDDLSRDGKVTLMVTNTTQRLERDASGRILSGASYTVLQRGKSYNVLQGEIKGGVLYIEPKPIRLAGTIYGEIAIRDTHMRIRSDGEKLVGYWGGFIRWRPYAYAYTSCPPCGADNMGLYHALKKMADAGPDPKTGQNEEITAAFSMEAVPAFLLASDGTVLAQPAPANSALGARSASSVLATDGAVSAPPTSPLSMTPANTAAPH